MNNYLTLEKMYSGLFKLNIRSDKGCSHVLVRSVIIYLLCTICRNQNLLS